jgi:hypothetical protein
MRTLLVPVRMMRAPVRMMRAPTRTMLRVEKSPFALLRKALSVPQTQFIVAWTMLSLTGRTLPPFQCPFRLRSASARPARDEFILFADTRHCEAG